MGSCFSCRTSPTFKNVRVVHLNGYVEQFEHPILVSQITGKFPKHFVYAPSQLLCVGSKPLKQDTLLQQGQVYFLVPYSSLQADVSPLEMALLVKRLTALAKTSKCEANSPMTSPLNNSQVQSPNRIVQPEMGLMSYGSQGSARARSWKPTMDPIKEKSFNRRSESELQEN